MGLVLLAIAAASEVDRCVSDGQITEGGPTRRTPVRSPVSTGLPIRAGLGGEVACPVFVEGDTVDVRCDGVAAAAVHAISRTWFSPTGPDPLLVWVSGGNATAVLFPPGVHWSELTRRATPTPTEAARRCVVRIVVGVDGLVLAARAKKECQSIEPVAGRPSGVRDGHELDFASPSLVDKDVGEAAEHATPIPSGPRPGRRGKGRLADRGHRSIDDAEELCPRGLVVGPRTRQPPTRTGMAPTSCW